MQRRETALYTTFYPGVEKFLQPWFRSVVGQSDRNFDLWIGLDSMSPEDATEAIGSSIEARWIVNAPGSSPAAIRDHAFRQLTEEYEALILVDADDVLDATRVEAARRALERQEVVGCALRLIDEEGADLGRVFSPAPAARPESQLARHNVFGLSNTAYRSDMLKACLPIPEGCILIDWLLATRAWALGARMDFDVTPRMYYRQYGGNTAGVLTPFSASQVLKASCRVLGHYDCLLDSGWPLPPRFREEIAAARARARQFYGAVTGSRQRLEEYVTALNRLEPQHVWWWCVAHSDLENLWKN